MTMRNLVSCIIVAFFIVTPFIPGYAKEKNARKESQEQCVRRLTDKMLSSRDHSVERYEFPKFSSTSNKYVGLVKLTNGSKIWIQKSSEDDALDAFTNALAMAIPGFALDRFDFRNTLRSECP